jgi:hypothetical protein
MIVTAAHPWRWCAVPGAVVRVDKAVIRKKRNLSMAGKAKLDVPRAGEAYYRLPESAHETLGDIRNELDMLARLAMRHCCAEDETLQLSSAALSQCFARLAVDIGAAIEACLAPSD